MFEDDKEDIETCRVVARCLRLGGKGAHVHHGDTLAKNAFAAFILSCPSKKCMLHAHIHDNRSRWGVGKPSWSLSVHPSAVPSSSSWSLPDIDHEATMGLRA